MTVYVNNAAIDDQTIDAEFERLKPQYEQYARRNEAEPDLEQLRKWAKENLIERTLLEQHATAAKEHNNEADANDDGATDSKSSPEQAVKRIIENVRAQAPAPTDPEVEIYYKKHRQHFNRPERVHAAHIVKHTADGYSDPSAYTEILNLREELRKGMPFEQLAAEHSDCPDRAGDLGTFERGQMVEAFDDVVFNLSPGEVSDVFQTPFGYHIAKVYEKYEGGEAPLEEVRSHIVEHLHEENRRTALDAFVDQLKEQADIRED